MYIVFIFIGIFLILTGLIIWKLKIVSIIAGYDPEKVIDRDGLARWVGGNIALMGILVTILGFIGIVVPDVKSFFIILVYLIIVLGLSITILIGTRRFEKRANDFKK